MRIVLVNHYAGSPTHGMEYRPYYLAREWVRMGHDVTIVAATQSHTRQKVPEAGMEIIDGVTYRWLPTPAYEGNGLRRAVNMACFVYKLRRALPELMSEGRFDVVIASSTYPSDIYPCRELARRCDAKLVWEVHDLWPLSPAELGGMPRWHPFIVAMQHGEDYACRHADVVISMLPEADRHLITRGMDPNKYCHIPNGIDVSGWSSNIVPLPEEHEQMLRSARASGHFIVGYAGAHGIANALHSFIDAAQYLESAGVTMVIIGQGPEKKALRRRAAPYSDSVLFLPPTPRGAIPELLSMCDALYIGLQRQDLFQFGVSPNKIFDYAMAAKPIVNAISAPNDLISEAQCGFSVNPEDPYAIASAIKNIVDMEPEKRTEMGRRGRDYVTKYHDYRILARRFLEEVMK